MSSPASPTRLRPRSRDTGFPEPFCGERNTTLPHPDANLSPDATISQDDIAVAKVLSRTRRSFLARHKRTISHGFLANDGLDGMYSEMSEAALASEHDLLRPSSSATAHDGAGAGLAGRGGKTAAHLPSIAAGRPSKDSLTSSDLQDDDRASTRSKRASFLRRLGFHHRSKHDDEHQS